MSLSQINDTGQYDVLEHSVDLIMLKQQILERGQQIINSTLFNFFILQQILYKIQKSKSDQLLNKILQLSQINQKEILRHKNINSSLFILSNFNLVFQMFITHYQEIYQFQFASYKMHNFVVPNKYRHITRLGNWSEEWELDQVKKKDSINNANIKAKLASTYKPASLNLSPDGYFHFRDHIMLYNRKTQGFLAVDIFKQLSKTQELYQVSTAKDLPPCARTVFILERVNPLDGYKDDILHYGQHFRIKINPKLLQKDVYLYSELVSLTKYSPISRLQEVNFGLKHNYSTVWVIQNPDPNLRFSGEGQPVKINDNILIKHLQTNQWLASDTQPLINDYGQEFQVMVHNFYVKSKSHNLTQQKKGTGTIDIPTKGQTSQNAWVIVGAGDESQQFQEEER